MIKLFFIYFFLPLLQVKCLFAGESCMADDKAGSCIVLSECKSLIAEIENAGNRKPIFMTERLQKLTCGFDRHFPLVCCTPSATSQTVSPNPLNITSIDHTVEEPNRGQSITTDNRNDNRPTVVDNEVWQNGSNNNVKNGPPDIENHPNLGLLPSADCGNIEDDKIMGGNRTDLFQMPWMVLLSYKLGFETKLSCGGTLINKWYVLTAAHCVSFLGNLRLEGVILGEHDVRRDPDCVTIGEVEICASNVKKARINKIIPHSEYNPTTSFNDIALIRLSKPADITLGNVKPLCLPISRDLQRQELKGENGVVAGWGITEIGLQSPVLLSVAVPIHDNNECITAFKGSVGVKDNQICAGGVRDMDSCSGDSGGPLMFPGNLGVGVVRYVQRGIVSYGNARCALGGFPVLYTRVAYFMDWILNNIRA